MMNAAWRSYWSILGGLLLMVGGLAAWLMLTAPVAPDAPADAKASATAPSVAMATQADTYMPANTATIPARSSLISPAGFMRGPSGGLLPRFMTLARDEAQVRLGPGQDYPVAWIIRSPGMPVEVLAETGDWLRIRDHEGEEGWLHAHALSGDRAALVAPWRHDAKVALRTVRSADAPLRAWVGSGVVVRLLACDGQWCRVRTGKVEGWLEQAQLWGVYHRERITAHNG